MTRAPAAVVLVHGLWVHGLVMALLGRRIARAGFRAHAYSYPTMRLSLTENALRLARYSRSRFPGSVHFVAHSLGGLVVLRMLECAGDVAVGRIVLAGVPAAGSHAARRLQALPGGRKALGRSMREWLTRGPAAPAPDRAIGVIAGSLGLGLGCLVAPRLPRPHDGAVSVAETVVPGMRERIVLPVSHSGMLLSAAVARQACAFLRDGAFAHDDGVTGAG